MIWRRVQGNSILTVAAVDFNPVALDRFLLANGDEALNGAYQNIASRRGIVESSTSSPR